MAVTLNDVEAFHQFAISRIRDSSGNDLTFDDLFLEWDSNCRRDDINARISQGIADVVSGRSRNAEEFNRELRDQYKLGK